jgi:hypothetical protein
VLLIATMQTKDQLKRGRPSDYSAEIAETICDRLALLGAAAADASSSIARASSSPRICEQQFR